MTHLTSHRNAASKPTDTMLNPRFQPFRSAEEAWLWTVAALSARRDGIRYTSRTGKAARPCEPSDIMRCLETLHQRGRIGILHTTVLRSWGERQSPPNPAFASERADWRLWREALDRLEWLLRVKGVVI